MSGSISSHAPVTDRPTESSQFFADQIAKAHQGDPAARDFLVQAAHASARVRAGKASHRKPRIVNDPSGLAIDIALIVLNKLHSFRGLRRRSFHAWVQSISRNEITRLFRRKSPVARPLDDLHYAIDPGPEPGDLLEEDRRLLQAIQRLSPKYEQVVRLHYFDGLSFTEIARQLGCKPNTIQRRGERALKELSQSLKSPTQ